MSDQQDPAPTDDPYDKSLSLALRGAVLGCVAVGVISGVMGVWPLFFAYPPFTVYLVLSALLGAALTGVLERLWIRPFPALAVMAIASILTFVFFAALPLYLFFHPMTWPAELLFG